MHNNAVRARSTGEHRVSYLCMASLPPNVFERRLSPLVGRQLFVGGGHSGHKIFGRADTPLRTRFRADGRKSFLPSTCTLSTCMLIYARR